MRKIILFLFSLVMFIPFLNAEETVKIKEITLNEKSDNAIEVANPMYEGFNINFNVKFNGIDDYIQYKVVIQNKDKEDYKIVNNNSNISEFVEYSFIYDDNDDVIKANSEKIMYVKIKYTKEVPTERLTEGKYTEEKQISLTIKNDSTGKVVNPKTGVNQGVVSTLLVMTITGIVMLIIIDKKEAKVLVTIIGICLLSIPFVVNALKELVLKVDSKVEIEAGCNYKLVTDKGSFVEGEDVKEVCFTPVDDGYQYDIYSYDLINNFDTSESTLIMINPSIFRENDYLRIYEDDTKEKLLLSFTYEDLPENRMIIKDGHIGFLQGQLISKNIGHYNYNELYIESSDNYFYFYQYAINIQKIENLSWIKDNNIMNKINTLEHWADDNSYTLNGFTNCNDENICTGNIYYAILTERK